MAPKKNKSPHGLVQWSITELNEQRVKWTRVVDELCLRESMRKWGVKGCVRAKVIEVTVISYILISGIKRLFSGWEHISQSPLPSHLKVQCIRLIVSAVGPPKTCHYRR